MTQQRYKLLTAQLIGLLSFLFGIITGNSGDWLEGGRVWRCSGSLRAGMRQDLDQKAASDVYGSVGGGGCLAPVGVLQTDWSLIARQVFSSLQMSSHLQNCSLTMYSLSWGGGNLDASP